MRTLPEDYEERVYAGILGKIIGVYLGRPFEGWSNARIEKELGEIWYYVNDHPKIKQPLIVTDDDISGMFMFLRTLEDYHYPYDIIPEMIGNTWLNYLIEKKTVLWWGGMGQSTEHTAYLRLKKGIKAPFSGRAETNGKVVSEQIGGRIFIDGWGMICPGDPDKAADFARTAASVSHDGEGIYSAQLLAVMQSLAFFEKDRGALMDAALMYIPRSSIFYQMTNFIREWHDASPKDWRATFQRIEDAYGYDQYGGGCHAVPNHAVLLLALLYGDDNFQKTLMIANTVGWDTDCNSGNIGCLMGIKNGLDGLSQGADLRTPVADRLFVPTADPGRGISDAVRKTYMVVNAARALQGLPLKYSNPGFQFHFNLPGAVQGFIPEDSSESRGTLQLENIVLSTVDTTAVEGDRALAFHYKGVGPGRVARAGTATFLDETTVHMGGYSLICSPLLFPGQVVRGRLLADEKNASSVQVNLYLRVWNGNALEKILRDVPVVLEPGESLNLAWEVPQTDGQPIAKVGIEISAMSGNSGISGHTGSGTVYLDWLGWNTIPRTTFWAPEAGGDLYRRQWVSALDEEFGGGGRQEETLYKLIQNEGTGLALLGDTKWSDYTVTTTVTPHLASRVGLVAACRGLRHYLALVISSDNIARLIQVSEGEETELDNVPMENKWQLDDEYTLSLTVKHTGEVLAQVGHDVLSMSVQIMPEFTKGCIGLLLTEGNAQFGPVTLMPCA